MPQFGDLESPCGPGSPTGTPDQGVGADTVSIGFGDDSGFQGSPGLGHEAGDAVEAMVEWCNEQGGINGRAVVGTRYDARVTELATAVTDACAKDFMLVGAFFALPESAEPIRLGCGLPTVPGLISGPALAMAPLMVAAMPNPIDFYNVGTAAVMAREFPDEVKKVGAIYADFPTLVSTIERFKRTSIGVGWEWADCDQTHPIQGVSDFRPYLQKLKDCGVTVVFSTAQSTNLQNQLDAANQLDFHPIWVDGPTAYTEVFAKGNTSGNGDRLYFGNSMVPLDYEAPGSANAAYRRIVQANGGDLGFVGQLSTSAFLLWATGSKACGADLTRDCVMGKLKAITEWDAGGLSVVQNPGQNLIDDCVQVTKLTGTAWEQWKPSEEGDFECDTSWAATVDPPVDAMDTLKVGSDRVAHNLVP